MSNVERTDGRLWGVSDLHVAYPDNREILEGVRPASDADWLLVAGDVGELTPHIEWALTRLKERFATVVWVPGNHELWTLADDPVQLRGDLRYKYLVDMCRRIGVLTPEDPYPVWHGPGGPARIAPLFLLYDYSFRPPGLSQQAALAWAEEAGIVCTDEFFLHPDPYPSRQDWCAARLALTEQRLSAHQDGLPTVLVNHFPLTRDPLKVLHHQEFAQWCGTTRTHDWHRRFNASVVVYGHLHIPRTTWADGVRFEEVSLGYPREWKQRPRPLLQSILPAEEPLGSS
ncbi:metallophosphoesterase [Microbispora sp. NPDC088329]|uniref:metallophosphoesterase family protein n=1 Tax=Microbispora sp. NPDC088329 TaxID=3154869 RepID=UPI00343725A2